VLLTVVLVAMWLVACSSGDESEPETTNAATATAVAESTSETAMTETVTATGDTAATVAGAVVADGEEWIAFQGVPRGISLIRSDGSGGHVILGPPGDQNHPDWSPDGSEIAYVQYDESSSVVMVTDVAGENPRPVTESLAPDLEGLFWENPAWSRDGSEIAMVGYEGDPNQVAPARSVLAIVEVATGDVTVAGALSRAEGRLHSFPRWSPDGQAMVLNVDHFDGDSYEGGTVAVIRRNGEAWSAPDEITEVGQYSRVDWHPAEDLIVFGDYDIGGVESTDQPTNLYTIRADGSGRAALTSFGAGEQRATQPTWTLDGRVLFVYVTGDEDEVREIAVIKADGSGLEVVVAAGAIGQYNRPHPRMRPR
jgi:Tol biopolymer transport system component